MHRFLIVLLGWVVLIAPAGCGDSEPPAESLPRQHQTLPRVPPLGAKSQFTGGWALVRIERRGADGELVAPPTEDRVGYLIYEPSGYMGVTIMQPDR